MTSVSAGHIILTPTLPVGSGQPQRESNLEPPKQQSSALQTELTPPPPPRERERETERESENERETEREIEIERERQTDSQRKTLYRN